MEVTWIIVQLPSGPLTTPVITARRSAFVDLRDDDDQELTEAS